MSFFKEDNLNKRNQSFIKSFLDFIIDVIKVAIISLAIIIPIRYFLIQPFYVKGASMEPNFHNREYLIIDEISYRFRDIQRGDIIVFKYPKDTREYFIKRVIGLPEETVEIKNGGVYIYNSRHSGGVKLNEDDYLNESVKTFGNQKITLGKDELFVLGDNRTASLDSRRFGPLERKYVIGKVWVRGWPFNRIGVFNLPSYNL